MCEAFALNGHDVTLIAKQFGSHPVEDTFHYYGVERSFQLVPIRCRKVKGINARLLPKLYRTLRGYDRRDVLIYARDIYGVSLAVRMGFRVVYEAHAAPYNRLIRYLETVLLRNPRLVRLVVISEALKSLYVSRFDIADKIVVCHDAAAVPALSSDSGLAWPPCRTTLQVGYTGHLYPGRGIEIIIACARELPQHDFHIVGGTDGDIDAWKRQATTNAFFHGFLEPAVISQACAKCDVLLMPYQKEILNPHSHLNTVPWMSPMKLFEYMASRKAIIASDLPVLREVLNERMAILVEPDDPEQWVDAIRRCEDITYREDLARNAYEALLQHHTWEKRARKVICGISS